MKTKRCLSILIVVAASLALALPRSAWAQFTYTTNNDTITITGFTGLGGNVIIPSTINGYPVTIIGTNAFYNQDILTSVTIPDSVTNISADAFADCSGLTNIVVNTTNPNYASTNGVLYNKALTTLIQFPEGLAGSYAIPSSVTNIGDDAFLGSSLRSVTIPDSVTRIGNGVFEWSYLTNLTIPDSVTSIGNNAFHYCRSLRSVTIGNSVTSIGDRAFAGCWDLTSVTIPSSVTNIGANAFGDEDYGLTNIAVNATNPNYASANGVLCNEALTTLIQFPQGLVGSYAIPDSVTSVGDYAFGDCSGLASVTIPYSVTNIGYCAFFWCSSLTSVTIPDSVTSIGNSAFELCSGLTSVTIGNSAASIGDSAFYYCYSLTNVTIPNSVTSIGAYAFEDCTNLHQAYFQGNAPSVGGVAGSADSTVFSGESGTVYYVPGTTGWGTTFGGWPTAQWYQPRPQILGSSSGVQSNRFQFTISWATNTAVVVEACTNLANPVWQPLGTNTLVGGSCYFSDPTWTNYPRCFYRVRSEP